MSSSVNLGGQGVVWPKAAVLCAVVALAGCGGSGGEGSDSEPVAGPPPLESPESLPSLPPPPPPPLFGASSGGGLDCVKGIFVPEGSLVPCVGGWLADLAIERAAKEGVEIAGTFLLNLLGFDADNAQIQEINKKLEQIQTQLAEQREAIATLQASENNVYSVLTELKLQTEQQAISALVNRVLGLQAILEVAINTQFVYLSRLKDLTESQASDKGKCVKSAANSLAQRCYEAFIDFQNATADFNTAYSAELGTNLATNKNLHDYLVAGKIGSGTVVTNYAEYLATRDGRAAFLTAEFSDRLAAFYLSIRAVQTLATIQKGIYLAGLRARTLDPFNQAAAEKRINDMLSVEVKDWWEAEIASLPPRIPAGVVVVMEVNTALRTTTLGQPMFLMPRDLATADPCGGLGGAPGSWPIDSAWRLKGSSSTTSPPNLTPDVDFFNFCKPVTDQFASLADVRTFLSRYNDPLDLTTSITSSLATPAKVPVGGGFTDWNMPRLSNPTDGSGYGARKLSEINYLFKDRPASLGLSAGASMAQVLGQMADGYSTNSFSKLTTPATSNRGRLWLRDEFNVPVWTKSYVASDPKSPTGSFDVSCTIGGGGYNGGNYSCSGPFGSPAHDWLETKWPTTDDLVQYRRQDSKQVLRFPQPECLTGSVTPCHEELAFRMSREGAVTLATRRTTVDYLKPLAAQGRLCNGVLFKEGNTTALKGANLTGCNLRALDLRGADLTNANLTKADLSGTKLDGAVLTGVNWTESTCPNGLPNGKQFPNIELACSTDLVFRP